VAVDEQVRVAVVGVPPFLLEFGHRSCVVVEDRHGLRVPNPLWTTVPSPVVLPGPDRVSWRR
jgi:hypothetical protein